MARILERLESIGASRWKKEVFQIATPPSMTSLFFFGELTGKMLGEAGLEKCGAR